MLSMDDEKDSRGLCGLATPEFVSWEHLIHTNTGAVMDFPSGSVRRHHSLQAEEETGAVPAFKPQRWELPS